MFYTQPTKKVEKKTGFTETYHFENEEKAKLTIGTLFGGWEEFPTTSVDRFYYILQGIGEAIMRDKQISIDGPVDIQLPANNFFKLDGQMRFLEVTGKTETKVIQLKETFKPEAGFNYIVYIVDGVGGFTLDGKKDVIREGSLLEIPKNSDFELTGNVNVLISKILA